MASRICADQIALALSEIGVISAAPRVFQTGSRSNALKAPIGTLVKHERATGNLFAREDLTKNDIVVARPMYRGDPATHLGRGTLQQRKSVCAERNREIFKSVLRPREAGRQFGLMLAKNIDREKSPASNG